jgi:hypothetical protein
LAFVADFGTQNFHFKNKIDMENKTLTNHENGNDANRLLPAVQRPRRASEALKLLKEGVQVEMETGKVFDFMRYVEKAERNFSFRCYVNEFTEGYTVLKHGR